MIFAQIVDQYWRKYRRRCNGEQHHGHRQRPITQEGNVLQSNIQRVLFNPVIGIIETIRTHLDQLLFLTRKIINDNNLTLNSL